MWSMQLLLHQLNLFSIADCPSIGQTEIREPVAEYKYRQMRHPGLHRCSQPPSWRVHVRLAASIAAAGDNLALGQLRWRPSRRHARPRRRSGSRAVRAA